MECRTTPAVYFRTILGFKQYDPITTEEPSMLSKVTTLFSAEKILLKYSVIGCRVDAYFSDQKLVVEINEKIHKDSY